MGLKLLKEELHLHNCTYRTALTELHLQNCTYRTALTNFSPNIIQVIKSKGMSWALLVASIVDEKCSYTGCWWGILNEGDRIEDVCVVEK